MKNKFAYSLVVLGLLACFVIPALADDRLKPNQSINEFTDLAGASVADGDFFLVYDLSAGDWMKSSLEGFAEMATALDGLTATAAEINLAADISANFEDVTATNILTTAECGKTMTLNSATEFVSTLPAPTAGCKFKFIVKAAPASASYTVVTASSANILIGGINELETDDTVDGPYIADGDTITFADGTAVVGDYLDVVSDGTSWYFSGQANAEGGVEPSQAD